MSAEWRQRITIASLRCLPTNLLSRLAGRVASWRLPPALQRLQIRLFGRAVGVNFDEVRDPIDSFASLQEFFTRTLKAGVRPIDPAPDAFVAPCDGLWGAAGIIESGTLLQVKGRPYSLAALLGSAEDAAGFEGGAYATFYLSPRDYHRFHMPCAVGVVRTRYLPGTLWPVNQAGVAGIDNLFAENERICAFAEVGHSPVRGMLCLVAVGATMVGKVHLTFDDLTTNRRAATAEVRTYETGHHFDKGEQWGRFEFGSTIVMVATPGLVELDCAPPRTPLRMGTRIGSLQDSER